MLEWSDEAIKEGIDRAMICVCASVFLSAPLLSSVTINNCVLSEVSQRPGKVAGKI